ncbi:MAG: hypothetical protein WCJ35_15100 [Planctomycetota bacterium]
MKTITDQQLDSIIREVRCLKEDNAAAYGFDIRLIAAAAQSRQREHPERIVTRIPKNSEPSQGGQPLTLPVAENEL